MRASVSGPALLPAEVLAPALRRLRGDLEDGTWRRRHGDLLECPGLDVGYRLVVGERAH